MFVSSYFPLALIFVIKDLDDTTFLPKHPVIAALIVVVFLGACAVVLRAARAIASGVPVTIARVSNMTHAPRGGFGRAHTPQGHRFNSYPRDTIECGQHCEWLREWFH